MRLPFRDLQLSQGALDAYLDYGSNAQNPVVLRIGEYSLNFLWKSCETAGTVRLDYDLGIEQYSHLVSSHCSSCFCVIARAQLELTIFTPLPVPNFGTGRGAIFEDGTRSATGLLYREIVTVSPFWTALSNSGKFAFAYAALTSIFFIVQHVVLCWARLACRFQKRPAKGGALRE